jgi:hypothetical protein
MRLELLSVGAIRPVRQIYALMTAEVQQISRGPFRASFPWAICSIGSVTISEAANGQKMIRRLERRAAVARTGLSRSRAYELIEGAGGIPGKMQARSHDETRAKHADYSRKDRKRKSSTTHSVVDNVIPWPKEIKKPKSDARPMGDKLEGDDTEELTGRFFIIPPTGKARKDGYACRASRGGCRAPHESARVFHDYRVSWKTRCRQHRADAG